MKRRSRIRAAAAALILGAGSAFGCSPALRIDPPFHIAEGSSTAREDMSAAVVRTKGLFRNSSFPRESESELREALASGLAGAVRALVRRVDVVAARPAAGYDFVVIPSNFVHDVGSNQVSLSMDVTVVRLRDAKEFGILIEGESGPGARPVVTWDRAAGSMNLTGAYVHNAAYGQALNNALFYLSLDFAKKLERRLDSLR